MKKRPEIGRISFDRIQHSAFSLRRQHMILAQHLRPQQNFLVYLGPELAQVLG